MDSKRIKRVYVDEDICLAHYLCEGEAPKVFFDDKDHYAVRIRDLTKNELDEEKPNILWAAHVCPVAAVKVEFEDGTIIDSDNKEFNEYINSIRT